MWNSIKKSTKTRLSGENYLGVLAFEVLVFDLLTSFLFFNLQRSVDILYVLANNVKLNEKSGQKFWVSGHHGKIVLNWKLAETAW